MLTIRWILAAVLGIAGAVALSAGSADGDQMKEGQRQSGDQQPRLRTVFRQRLQSLRHAAGRRHQLQRWPQRRQLQSGPRLIPRRRQPSAV